MRGQSHLEVLLQRKDVEITAMCDINDTMLSSAKRQFTKANKAIPKIFTGDPHAYRTLLADKALDGIIIATP